MKIYLVSLSFIFLIATVSCVNQNPVKSEFKEDFNQHEIGKLMDRRMKEMWAGSHLVYGKKDFIFYKLGITPHPHFIAEEGENKFLKVLIPKKHYGPIVGAQWKIPLAPANEYFFRYRIRFPVEFDFVKGGKLPGLAGGEANSGGHVPNGFDGWSARMMFWEHGKLSYYLYYPNQSSTWGERLYLENLTKDTLHISKGTWHSITQHIKMNTPDKTDGILQAWFDGQEAFYCDTILFRKTQNLKIDQIFYSVFLGGDDLSWTSAKDEYICFDDFQVSTQLIND